MTGQLVADKRIAAWVFERLGYSNGNVEGCAGLGLLREGRLVVGLAYNHFLWPSIEINIAADGVWATPEMMYHIFAYPFLQLNCRRVGGHIAARNYKSRELAEHAGFVQEGVMRKALKDDDLVVYGLLREDCKWISADFCKRFAKAA